MTAGKCSIYSLAKVCLTSLHVRKCHIYNHGKRLLQIEVCISEVLIFKGECYFTSFMVRFGLVWFGLVLWHINHHALFSAKSILYI